MKAMVKIFVLVLFVVAAGCKTQKSTLSEKSSTLTELDSKTEEHNELNASEQSNEKISDQSLELDSVHKSTVDVHLSAPDSTGKQYPTGITYTDETRNSSKKSDVKNDKKSNKNIAAETDKKDETDLKLDDKKKVESAEETETQNPNWMNWGIGIGLIVLGVIAYLFLRRFGLVK